MFKKAQVTIFVIFGFILVLLVLFLIFFSKKDDPLIFESSENNVSIEEFELVFNESVFFADTFYSLRDDWSYDLDELSFEEMVDNYIQEEINLSIGLGVGLSFSKGGAFDISQDNFVSVSGPISYHIGQGASAPSEDVIIRNLEVFIVDFLKLQLNQEQFKAMNVYFDNIKVNVNFNNDFVVANVKARMIDSSLETSSLEYDVEFPLRAHRVLEVRDEVIENLNNDPNAIHSFAYDDVDVNFLSFDDETLIVSILDPASDLFGEPLVYNFAADHQPSNTLRLGFIPDFITEVNFPVSYVLKPIYQGDDELKFSVNSDLVELDSSSGSFTFLPNEKKVFNFNFCVSDSNSKVCEEVTINVI